MDSGGRQGCSSAANEGNRFVDSTRRGTVILINVISPCKKCDELIAMPVAGERRKNLCLGVVSLG